MKKIFLLMFIFFPSITWADKIYLSKGDIVNGTVTEVTATAIKYNAEDENKLIELSRNDVLKIVYSSGKEVDFYDKIYLLDGEIIKCRIIRVAGVYIEIKPEGNILFDRVSKESIFKIIYDDGNVEKMLDEIYTKDGEIIRGSIIQITDEYIAYDPVGNKTYEHYPRGNLLKIVYADGRTTSLNDETPDKSDNKSVALEPESKITTHMDSPWNIFFLFNIGIGGRRNPKVKDWTNDYAHIYLEYLQNEVGICDNCYVANSTNEYNVDIGIEVETRLFTNYGFGIGLGAGAFTIIDNTDTSIKSEFGEISFMRSDLSVTNIYGALYYKKYCKEYSLKYVPYVLVGIGTGIYWAEYDVEILYDQDHPALYSSLFDKEYSGDTLAVHSIFEVGIEDHFMMFFIGLKYLYGEVETLKSGHEVMITRYGAKCTARLTGVTLYLGIGIHTDYED
ncbi:MAG: hypothetical protein SVZ03_14390 [Spirochaetota bacterium]|nr:hypothetical protein [Spirochaetota bacterium]